MSRLDQLSPDLLRQIAAAVDDQLTAEELSQLEAKLLEEPRAMQVYWDMSQITMELHTRERSRRGTRAGLTSISASLQETVVEATAGAEIEPPVRRKSLLDRASKHPMSPSVAVAIVTLSAVLFGLYMTPVARFLALEEQGEKPEVERPVEKAIHVAILNRQQNAKWLDATEPAAHDPRLWPGRRLKISKGLLEIKYKTGAVVVIEGPAAYYVGGKDEGGSLQPSNSGYLALGRLVARCDSPESKGFQVATPHAVIEDISTEFGVDVQRGQKEVVSVLEGSVELLNADGSRGATPRIIEANHSAYVDATLLADAAVRVETTPKNIRSSYRRSIPQPLPQIINGGFERAIETGTSYSLTSTGHWQSEATEEVSAENGIQPYRGRQMLKFVYADARGPGKTAGSQVYYAIELRAHSQAIADGRLRVRASARFNRVAGNKKTDTNFRFFVIPLPGQVTGAKSDHHKVAGSKFDQVESDADPATWEQATVEMQIPPQTQTLLIQIHAGENVFNNERGREFDGHYVDDVRVEFEIEPSADTTANEADNLTNVKPEER